MSFDHFLHACQKIRFNDTFLVQYPKVSIIAIWHANARTGSCIVVYADPSRSLRVARHHQVTSHCGIEAASISSMQSTRNLAAQSRSISARDTTITGGIMTDFRVITNLSTVIQTSGWEQNYFFFKGEIKGTEKLPGLSSESQRESLTPLQ